MSVIQFFGFLGLAVAAAYLQALTGFAFALVLMGGVALFDLMRSNMPRSSSDC